MSSDANHAYPMRVRVWECKVVIEGDDVPENADGPMRFGIATMCKVVTGRDPLDIFSGWGGTLTDIERALVERDRTAPNEV